MRAKEARNLIAFATTAACLLMFFQNCGAAKLEGNSAVQTLPSTDRLGASVVLPSLLGSPRENSTNLLYPAQSTAKTIRGYSQETPIMENVIFRTNDFDRVEWVHADSSTVAAIGETFDQKIYSEATKGQYYVFGYRGESAFLIHEFQLDEMGSSRLGVNSANAVQTQQQTVNSETDSESILISVEAPSVALKEIEFVFKNNTGILHSRRAILVTKKQNESMELELRLTDISGETIIKQLTLPARAAPMPQTCSFDGKSVANGGSITAYEAASVPSGSTCKSQTRTCADGVLSGTYAHAACIVLMPQACGFNGMSVANGSSVTAYQASSVPYGSSCLSQTRTCTNGTLSGTYAFQTCTSVAPKNCTFNGNTIAHGSSVNTFQAASVPYGSSCASQSRTCDNGVLSGSYQFASCAVQAPQNCSFNGSSVANGASVTAFQTSSVAYGSTCASQTRTCSNGTLSGTYTFPSCSVQAPQSCTFNGKTIASGSSVTAYQASSVPFGSTCVSQTRTCSNGTLNGTYQNASCTVQTPTTTQILMMSPSSLTARLGQSLQVTIPYYAKPMADNYHIFIHFVDSNGVQAISSGGWPSTGTASWNGPVNFTISVPIPANIPTGVYTIRTGLYVYTPPYTTRIQMERGAGVTVDESTRYTVGTVTINP